MKKIGTTENGLLVEVSPALFEAMLLVDTLLMPRNGRADDAPVAGPVEKAAVEPVEGLPAPAPAKVKKPAAKSRRAGRGAKIEAPAKMVACEICGVEFERKGCKKCCSPECVAEKERRYGRSRYEATANKTPAAVEDALAAARNKLTEPEA